MEEMITVSAKTLDEAITNALIELKITSEHLHYEVIQKESSGFLGLIGTKPCVIRARAMSEAEERAIRQAAADKEKEEKAAAQKAAAEKAAAEKAEKASAQKAATEKISAQNPKAPMDKAAVKPEKPEKKDFPKKEALRRENRKDQNTRQENVLKKENLDSAAKAGYTEKEQEEKPAVKIDEEAVKKAAKEFLNQVFGAMGMTVTIESSYDASERELQVMMAGDDMGILIGKRGQTLDSLQYLVSLVVNKETEGYLRVKLDTENYRERRKETLETLAKNISYKVKRTKKPVSLEPMNPYERRIIHSALQNDRYVVTRSEGEDPYRHVVISLKKEGYGGGRKDKYPSRRDRDKNYENRAEKNADKVPEPAVTVPVQDGTES